ncbi:hypothetical protein GCM10025857_66360 [Alicyclobacillus contaminans]|nr:hypothetical protein GCM10025857_66360 [Alicyclobacillus contaminans]
MYKKIFVKKGNGWGKGLEIQPEGKKVKIISVTGGESIQLLKRWLT